MMSLWTDFHFFVIVSAREYYICTAENFHFIVMFFELLFLSLHISSYLSNRSNLLLEVH